MEYTDIHAKLILFVIHLFSISQARFELRKRVTETNSDCFELCQPVSYVNFSFEIIVSHKTLNCSQNAQDETDASDIEKTTCALFWDWYEMIAPGLTFLKSPEEKMSFSNFLQVISFFCIFHLLWCPRIITAKSSILVWCNVNFSSVHCCSSRTWLDMNLVVDSPYFPT